MPFRLVEEGGVRITAAGMALLGAILVPGVIAVGAAFVLQYRVEQGDFDRGRIWSELQIRSDKRTQEIQGLRTATDGNSVLITRLEDGQSQATRDMGKLEAKIETLLVDMQKAQYILAKVDALDRKLDTQEAARNQRNDQLNAAITDLTVSLNGIRGDFAQMGKTLATLGEQNRSSNQRLDDLLSGRLIPTSPYTGKGLPNAPR